MFSFSRPNKGKTKPKKARMKPPAVSFGEMQMRKLLQGSEFEEVCTNCGVSGAWLPCLQDCGEAFYCEESCRLNHARSHRKLCLNKQSKRNLFSRDSSPLASASEHSDLESEEEKSLTRDVDVKSDNQDELPQDFEKQLEQRLEQKIMNKFQSTQEERIDRAVEEHLQKIRQASDLSAEEFDRIAGAVKDSLYIEYELREAEREQAPERDNLENDTNNEQTNEEPGHEEEEQKPVMLFQPELASALEVREDLAQEIEDNQLEDGFEWNASNPIFQCLYFFVWNGGSVGFEVERTAESDLIVSKVQPESSAWQNGVRENHALISVAGQNVEGKEANEVVRLIQKSDIPAILRFQQRFPNEMDSTTYTITWTEGKLGVSIKADGEHNIPIVHRMTSRTSSLAQSLGVIQGDVLIRVNEIDTVRLGCRETLKLLLTSPKPVDLTFQRNARHSQCLPGSEPAPEEQVLTCCVKPPPSTEHEEPAVAPTETTKPSVERPRDKPARNSEANRFIITWNDGYLGLSLKHDKRKTRLPVVHRITQQASADSKVETLKPGDVLIAINNEPVLADAFEETCTKLHNLPKPVALEFDRQYRRLNSIFGDHLTFRSICSPSELQNEYQVKWEKGQELGLIIGFRHNATGHREPFVRRVKSTSSLVFPGDKSPVGHTIVAVNNEIAIDLSRSELRRVLRQATRPATLRFRGSAQRPSRPSDPRQSHRGTSITSLEPEAPNYNLMWTEQQLGITFTPGPAPYRTVLVKSVNGGNAKASGLVKEQDKLVSINGKKVSETQSFTKTMEILQTLSKPIVLGFTRG